MRHSLNLFGMRNTARYEDPEITLGWRLRIALERSGVKADEMATRLGVHRGTITRWSHDIGSPPRLVYLEKWAEITGVRLDWLKGRDTDRESGSDTHQFWDEIAA